MWWCRKKGSMSLIGSMGSKGLIGSKSLISSISSMGLDLRLSVTALVLNNTEQKLLYLL